MKLGDFLRVISRDDFICIWNLDDKKRHVRRQYCKACNIKWEKIHDTIDYDVLGVKHTENGYFVRIYKKSRVDESLKEWNLIDKYFHRLDQRNGVRK